MCVRAYYSDDFITRVLVVTHFLLNLLTILSHLSTFYNKRPINCFASSKYLGVKLNSKLNFKSHICIIDNKVARSVGILSKHCDLFSSSALLLLYYSIIHPHLLFGLPLWGNANQSYLNGLQCLQNKAIKIITDS